MKPLFRHVMALHRKMGKRELMIFLDFDGTLSPIVPRPADAHLPRAEKHLLDLLRRRSEGGVAIVSGRARKDLKRKVALEGIFYVGNHGLEIEGPQLRFQAPGTTGSRKALSELKRKLSRVTADVPGTEMEDKGLSMSLHYRRTKAKNIPALRRAFLDAAGPYISSRKIRVTEGKRVFEIRPPVNWHKGSAVRWLLRYRRRSGRAFFPIYIGDDVTDEDAFAAVRRVGLGIRVGCRSDSQAAYCLERRSQVVRLLQELLRRQENRR